jgi:hypothetical protein
MDFKKLLYTFGLSVLFLGLNTFLILPVEANDCQNLQPFDEVKVPGKPALYVLDTNRALRFYPDGGVYKTWKPAYGGYKKIDEVCLFSLVTPTTNPFSINFRPGSKLIQKEFSTQLYVIEPGNSLVPITTYAASLLYKNFVPTILTAQQLSNYAISSNTLISNPIVHPGMIFRINSQVWYVNKNNQLQEITSDGLSSNHVAEQFIRTFGVENIQGLSKTEPIRSWVAELSDQTQSSVVQNSPVPEIPHPLPPQQPPVIPTTTQLSRDAAQWPFSPLSPWNMPLAVTAQFSPDGDLCTKDITDPTPYIGLNSTQWSMPVYQASQNDPEVVISLDQKWGQGKGKIATIKIPANATPSLPDISIDSNSDSHLLIIDPTHHYVDEMWKVENRQQNTILTAGYSRNDIYGLGIEQGGERAYGGSALAGLIRDGELEKGIPHALAMAVPKQKQKCCRAIWPATSIDSVGDGYKGNVPVGQLIAIPSGIDLTKLKLSGYGLKIAEALQKYGAYDVDSSSDVSFFMEPTAAKKIGLSSEGNDLHADFVKMRPYFKCVTNNSRETVGGGAQGVLRMAPLAPALQ